MCNRKITYLLWYFFWFTICLRLLFFLFLFLFRFVLSAETDWSQRPFLLNLSTTCQVTTSFKLNQNGPIVFQINNYWRTVKVKVTTTTIINEQSKIFFVWESQYFLVYTQSNTVRQYNLLTSAFHRASL